MNRDVINDQAWREFEDELAECLSEMDEDDSLIISDRLSGIYVQFSGDGPGSPMLANAIGNRFLAPDHGLSDDQCAVMLELGWFAPDEDNRASAGNFFLFDNSPGDYSWLARLAVRTLREVYGVNRLSRLQYEAFVPEDLARRRPYAPIFFPTLLIRRKCEE
jgi:hypothetical protein